MGWIIIGVIIALIVQIAFAAVFSNLAYEKGYEGRTYFWVCFFFGTIGYCMVAALPDRILHEKLDAIIYDCGLVDSVSAEDQTWICGKCNTKNSMSHAQCKKCGKYRSS